MTKTIVYADGGSVLGSDTQYLMQNRKEVDEEAD
jgi:hypothetical protein